MSPGLHYKPNAEALQIFIFDAKQLNKRIPIRRTILIFFYVADVNLFLTEGKIFSHKSNANGRVQNLILNATFT